MRRLPLPRRSGWLDSRLGAFGRGRSPWVGRGVAAATLEPLGSLGAVLEHRAVGVARPWVAGALFWGSRAVGRCGLRAGEEGSTRGAPAGGKRADSQAVGRRRTGPGRLDAGTRES